MHTRAAAFTLIAIFAAATARCDDTEPSFFMLTDPELHVPPVLHALDPATLPLWREVLQRPETDYQRLAADAVGRSHRRGVTGLEVARPELLQVIQNKDAHPVAVAAAAQALIALDTRDAADALFAAANRYPPDVRQVIEPALADWRYEPIRDVWRSRLSDSKARRREVMLAMDGLAKASDSAALKPLTEMVRDAQRPSDIRLAAARAAGAVADNGLEPVASDLLAGPSPRVLNRLCAAAVLTRHTSEPARTQLINLARDAEPTVAAAALDSLLGIDPQLLLPLLEDVLQNADANVRLCGVRACVAVPTPDHLQRLAQVLNDSHPDVRRQARQGLIEHGRNSELAQVVLSASMSVLAGNDWRGQEQAALLLAALDHKPAATRLIEVLEVERPEAMIAAAWALKKLAIPDTAPAMLDKATRQTKARLEHHLNDLDNTDLQVAHLMEALALLDHRDAMPLMQQHVPKTIGQGMLGKHARSASIWALGRLLKGQPNDELAAALMARASDFPKNPGDIPEYDLVRIMSVISIGRMHATSQIEALKKLYDSQYGSDEEQTALVWCIHELTGEEFPSRPQRTIFLRDWFLMPLADAP